MKPLEFGDLLTCLLGLSRNIVTVDFTSEVETYNLWSEPELKGKLSFCAMLRLASIDKARKATAKNFLCPGSSQVFQMSQPSKKEVVQRLHGFGLYENVDIAAKAYDNLLTLREKQYGVRVSSLISSTTVPKVVVIIADAYQVMRLSQGWTYSFGGVQGLTFSGNRGICSDCVARPYINDTLQISPLCSNTRYTGQWGDNELGVGVPFHLLEQLVKGVLHTAAATETPQKKKMIQARCTAKGIDIDIESTKPYFL